MEMKYDDGKLKAGILIEDFPLALKEVAAVSTYGDLKYKRSSWKTVPDCQVRYKDAKMRHVIEEGISDTDDESELYHLAHEAWNCLALLQLKLEELGEGRDYSQSFENARAAKKKAEEKERVDTVTVVSPPMIEDLFSRQLELLKKENQVFPSAIEGIYVG